MAAPNAAALDVDNVDIPVPGLAAPEKVVRPVLAVLFRVAIGPRADRYTPRFLAFERNGRNLFSWHWPSLIAPSLWAFYRKLWVSGVVFALLRLSVVAAFILLAPSFGYSDPFWYGVGILVALILPGIVPAALADWLLYRRVRALVRAAEACSVNAAQAAAWLNALRPTSETTAVLLSFAVVCAGIATLGPAVWSNYADHVVRLQVTDTIAAVRWVQQRVEAELERGGEPDVAVAGPTAAPTLDNLDVSPSSGRVRLWFGPAVPELAGKWILLAPARADGERVRWLCIPVDIPARYLPRSCRDS